MDKPQLSSLGCISWILFPICGMISSVVASVAFNMSNGFDGFFLWGIFASLAIGFFSSLLSILVNFFSRKYLFLTFSTFLSGASSFFVCLLMMRSINLLHAVQISLAVGFALGLASWVYGRVGCENKVY